MSNNGTCDTSNSVFLDVRTFGGVGDGVALNTRAFRDACASATARGGGTIVVPPGHFRTGSVLLPGHTTLQLEAGAVILGSQDPSDYPLRKHAWEGVVADMPDPLIGACEVEGVAVRGDGVIDGCGQSWWEGLRRDGALKRPRLIGFDRCRRVMVEGVTLTNSPAWTVHPWECEDVAVRGIRILNPADSPNTDGINPESCRDVRISDCLIHAGDDCITLKSGASADGSGVFKPCERIGIVNCQLSQGHGGVVIGSEMSGGVRDVTIANCVFHGTDRGIRIKTRRGRGGVVENLTATNLIMREVGCPLVINAYYRYTDMRNDLRAWAASVEAEAVTAGTPVIRGIRIHGLTACDVGGPCLAYLHGIPESPIARVVLSDCDMGHATEPDPAMAEPAMMLIKGRGDYASGGLFAIHVAGLRLSNARFYPRAGKPVVLERVTDYEGPA
jgi:polygalacturonase